MNSRTAVATGVLALGALGVSAAPAWASNGGNGTGHSASSGASASSPSASGQGDSPPGNNGHIQIDEYAMDGGNGNDPHVACGFSVTFFGYDAGTQKATITLSPWAPTGGGHPATYGPLSWTVDQRTGGNQRDFNYPVSPADVKAVFAGVTPAHQGYHARVEVEVTGSQGSDDKFKMLWIAPCTGSSAPTAGSSVAGELAAPSHGGTTGHSSASASPATAAAPAGSTADSPSASATGSSGPSAEVLGEAICPAEARSLPPVPASAARATSTPAGGLLAFTGANIAGLSGLALAMAGGGLLLVRRSRRPLSR